MEVSISGSPAYFLNCLGNICGWGCGVLGSTKFLVSGNGCQSVSKLGEKSGIEGDFIRSFALGKIAGQSGYGHGKFTGLHINTSNQNM